MTGAESAVDLDHARVIEAYEAVRQFANVVADSDVDPDDLVQEAMVRTLSRGSLSDVRDVVAYLRRAVLNSAANHRRSQGRRRKALARLGGRRTEDQTPGPELPSDLSELVRLAPIDRAVLYLFVVEGRPHREVAALVDLSETAVRARVSRSLKRLRVDLEEDPHGHAL